MAEVASGERSATAFETYRGALELVERAREKNLRALRQAASVADAAGALVSRGQEALSALDVAVQACPPSGNPCGLAELTDLVDYLETVRALVNAAEGLALLCNLPVDGAILTNWRIDAVCRLQRAGHAIATLMPAAELKRHADAIEESRLRRAPLINASQESAELSKLASRQAEMARHDEWIQKRKALEESSSRRERDLAGRLEVLEKSAQSVRRELAGREQERAHVLSASYTIGFALALAGFLVCGSIGFIVGIAGMHAVGGLVFGICGASIASLFGFLRNMARVRAPLDDPRNQLDSVEAEIAATVRAQQRAKEQLAAELERHDRLAPGTASRS